MNIAKTDPVPEQDFLYINGCGLLGNLTGKNGSRSTIWWDDEGVGTKDYDDVYVVTHFELVGVLHEDGWLMLPMPIRLCVKHGCGRPAVVSESSDDCPSNDLCSKCATGRSDGAQIGTVVKAEWCRKETA